MPVISTNTAANTAVRYLNSNSSDQSDSLAKLASGSRITKASDDAAGLAIATKISSDVTALEQASTNASHGISILQTADGGASNVSDILERMKTLSSQSASGTVTDTERAYIQAEFEQLQEEIDAISTSTRYNGQSLLDGTSDFADDTVETVAEVTTDVTSAATVTGAAGTAASVSSTGSITAWDLSTSNSVTFDVTDSSGTATTITLENTSTTDAKSYDADTLATEINAQLEAAGANVTVTSDGSKLTFTSTDTGADAAITIDNFTGDIAGGSSDAFDEAELGLSTTASDNDVTGSDSLFSLADGAEVSFDVSGTTVTLSNSSGSAVDYDTEALAEAIQDALTDAGNTDVTASVDATTGELLLTSSATGSSATVTVDNFTGDINNGSSDPLDAAVLGLTETDTDTGAVEATGESDAFTLADGQEVTFDVDDTTITLTNDTGEDDTYTTSELADAINTQLVDAGNYEVTASVDEETGELVLSTRDEGDDSTVKLSNFSGTGALVDENGDAADFTMADLGLTDETATATGTTTKAETTGADIVVGSDYTDTITLTLTELTTDSLGIDELDVSTQAGAEEALAVLDMAIDEVSNARAEMGATMSRFEFRSTQLETSIENLEAAESAISDVDIASEQAALSASSVKVQAAVAAASQANQMPENLLKLLQ